MCKHSSPLRTWGHPVNEAGVLFLFVTSLWGALLIWINMGWTERWPLGASLPVLHWGMYGEWAWLRCRGCWLWRVGGYPNSVVYLAKEWQRNDNDNHILLLPHAIPHNVYIPICPTHTVSSPIEETWWMYSANMSVFVHMWVHTYVQREGRLDGVKHYTM